MNNYLTILLSSIGIPELIILLFVFALILLPIIGYWKIFEKANQPGWAAIIPIYNFIILLKIVGKPWWFLLLILIPGLNIIFLVWIFNLLSKSFGKSVAFTIGLVLLPFIFIPILGFGDTQYQGVSAG